MDALTAHATIAERCVAANGDPLDVLADTALAILSGQLDGAEHWQEIESAIEHGRSLFNADIVGDDDLNTAACEVLYALEQEHGEACEAAERLQPWFEAAPNN